MWLVDDLRKDLTSLYRASNNKEFNISRSSTQYYSGRDDIVNKKKKPRRKKGL